MNVFLRILIGFGGVCILLFGLMFLGGGQMFSGVFAMGGIDIGSTMFSMIAYPALLIGGLGCWGAFGDNKVAAGIFCAIMLIMWPIGTVYAIICFSLMLFGNKTEEGTQETT